MLTECTGPLNFTMFLSLFAQKIGCMDPESAILNAFSILDPDQTGFYYFNIMEFYQNINLMIVMLFN
jgi:Ca2+-binding EF-hand superfamily protein